MEKQFDIFINGAYIGRASGSTCAAIRDREAKRPHLVHGVVLEDSDPPRLVLNPVHDESPALVRRVVEALRDEPAGIHEGENLLLTVVYLGTQRAGMVMGASPSELYRELAQIPGISGGRLDILYPAQAEIHVDAYMYGEPEKVFDSMKKVIDGWHSRKKDPLKEAARAFEHAINTESGIDVAVDRLDVGTYGDPERQRWQIKVTRNERKQVYP